MSVELTVAEVPFPFPEIGDTEWGGQVTAWATAISASSLYKSGGAFALTAEVDFGANFGLKSVLFKSRTANAASAGLVRLARADEIKWRNQLNTTDIALGVNASNQLTFGGTALGFSTQPTFSDGTTIDFTLLANDVTAEVAATSITNAHVSAAAAIAVSKLAALTPSRAVVTDGSGVLTPATTTATEIGYVNGVSSAIQTQLDAKQPTVTVSDTATIDLTFAANVLSAAIQATSIDNSMIAAAAAIARSKIAVGTANRLVYNLTGTGAMSDLAAITASRILQSDSSGLPVAGNAITASRMVQSDSNGFLTANAAITASRAVASDSNGFLVAATTTAAELNFVNGVTSAIQTQLDALAPGIKLLQVYTPSAAASVDITSQISSTYDVYLITYQLVPATDNVEVLVRTDSNNGASFDASAGNYAYTQAAATTSAVSGTGGSSSATSIAMSSSGVGNATNEGASGHIFVSFRGSGTRYPLLTYVNTHLTASTTIVTVSGSGSRLTAAAIDAVQLLFSSGNIASGTVRIYGLKNS